MKVTETQVDRLVKFKDLPFGQVYKSTFMENGRMAVSCNWCMRISSGDNMAVELSTGTCFRTTNMDTLCIIAQELNVTYSSGYTDLINPDDE